MLDFQTFIAILTTLLVFLTGVFINYAPSNLETTNLSSPNGLNSSPQGLLSRLWSWINSYGGLSDLRKYNAKLRKQNEEMRKQDSEYNAKMKKLDEEHNAKMKKLDDEKRIQHEQRMNDLRQQNARLAELESKLDIVLQSSDSNLIPTIFTDNN